jgi:hypothetical protein
MQVIYDARRNEDCAYLLGEHETPFGHTFGNLKTFASSTPKGGIRALWDADSDQIIFGTHQVAYRVTSAGQTYFPHHVSRSFTFLPYAQVAEFILPTGLQVNETFFVPMGPEHERTVAFVLDVEVENLGDAEEELVIFPWSLLVGQRFYGDLESEVRADVVGGSIRAENIETGATRWWGASRPPAIAVVALREGALRQGMEQGSLAGRGHLAEVTPELAAYASRRVFGAFEYRITIAPRMRDSLRIAVAFHRTSGEVAQRRLGALLTDAQALPDTKAAYARFLGDARFMTPSPAISRGVVWAKVNMLRVAKEYPQGWGSTNSPPSDILVSRDTSWFVHGYDYLWPQFSRDALEVFNRNLEESGQVVEYVRGVGGYKTTYGLTINDDTPLHLIAMLHYYNTTHDRAWIVERIALIKRVADYLLSQRDSRGLIFCCAGGVDMFGITSWRNIIPSYTLDGAVTEINAEAVFALHAAARLCEVAGDAANAEHYHDEAAALREAMMRSLFSADTEAFVLNYDQHENYQDDFTADEIFPVLYGIADAAQCRAILSRLCEADFSTPVGLRTISSADGWYAPLHGFGLLGGVWPDLTLWFVAALARNGLNGEAVERLALLVEAMECGIARNTVPGQFAEWYDGGSLVNRGMYLSPWTGAKYLWAVAETVGGLDGYRLDDDCSLRPALPESWRWSAAARVRRHGRHLTYVIDAENGCIYTDAADLRAAAPYRAVFLGRDVSDECLVSPVEICALAFENEQGEVRIFLGNTEDADRTVDLEFRKARWSRHLSAGALGDILLPGSER